MTAIFFVLGLIVGSFLNVVISRLPRMESLLGRSRCPKCRRAIRWHDNIPLFSYAVLGTRCRDCREKISWQYPAVEFGTAAVFALTGHYFFALGDFQSWLATFFLLAFFSLLIVIFVYDLKHMEIPMLMVWLGIAVFVVFCLIQLAANFASGSDPFLPGFLPFLFSGVGAFLFFFALSAVSREKWMGFGDAYVALLIGLVLGWPLIFWDIVMAFASGAIYGVILIIIGRKTMKSQVPFAPFLASAAMLAIFIPKIFPAAREWLLFF